MVSTCARRRRFKSEVLRQHLKEHNIWGSWAFRGNFSHTKKKVSSKCRALQAFIVDHSATTAITQLPGAENITVRIKYITESQRQSASMKGGWGQHRNQRRRARQTRSPCFGTTWRVQAEVPKQGSSEMGKLKASSHWQKIMFSKF